MAPHQERVVTEKAELDEKIAKLTEFTKGTIFAGLDYSERMRLETQLNYMQGYSHVLGWRIDAFK